MNEKIENINQAMNQIIVGKPEKVRLALCCMLAGGHLLMEDLPGTGKTLLSLSLARLTGLDFNRVQCTNDLMPADVLGTYVFDRKEGEFQLRKGPVFTQLLLVDEINRTSPKTQSALLEAMGEKQVSLEGHSLALPSPFFVIATQNPLGQSGTFPLPEAQLDRFMMRISLGYAEAQQEVLILAGEDRRVELEQTEALLDSEQLLVLQATVKAIPCSEVLIGYVQRLLQYTRDTQQFMPGLSTRAGQALLAAAKAYALLNQDKFVIPAHVQAVFEAVVAHRLNLDGGMEMAEQACRQILEQVDV